MRQRLLKYLAHQCYHVEIALLQRHGKKGVGGVFMELPKNITQIGECDRCCKIYVEDYVISYMKQLNRYAGDKDMAIALYGVRREEAGITYLFFYGACKLNFLQRECRHLSQAQLQEIEKQRRRFFPEYAFLGYRLLNGEMVEGFHIYEQGVCRYITGYAQFYEKMTVCLHLCWRNVGKTSDRKK